MADYPFRSALITGASSGIGAAMAEALGAAGVPTILVARRGDRLQEIADRFAGFEVLEADLTKKKGRQATIEAIADPDDAPDLVVNNAGFGSSGRFDRLDPSRLADEIDLNVGALTALSHAALARMIPQQRGYLLNVSSVASFQAVPGLAVYAATKAYVTSLTEALHEEAATSGVHVTALCPGLTRTEFQEQSDTTEIERRVPELMWSSAEEVALAGLDAVARNRTLAIPGAVNKSAATISSLTPRMLTRKVTRLMNRDI
ncbi:MAG: SDR family NAD(P)-dependent oxidoreductase [Actinomycetota bacterium]